MNPSLAHQSRRFQPSQTTRLASRRRKSVAAMLQAVPLATALLLGSQIASAQTYYHAQALPELQPQGGPSSQGWTLGWALNDSGVVVGQTQALSAVRWSFAAGLQNLGSPAQAYAIANNGTAVGYVNTLGVDGIVPVRWSPTTGYSELSTVYAGAPVNGIAWAVNNQDWVLATDTTGGGNNGLLLLRPGQAALNLGPVGVGDIRFNTMINANGMVAGTTSIAVGGQNIGQGFIWTETGGARTFSALAGGSTRVGGLNDNGLVVGDTFPVGLSIPDGFIYNANTGTLLQSLPGFSATDINNAGAIVGIQYGGGVPQGSSAAEWRNGAAVNLNSVTSNLGVYHLVQAVDINASGQILAFGQVNPALAGTNYTGPALRPFLLSECARCGQIKPYPIAAGDTLEVGFDWFDAFNGVTFENQGTLTLYASVLNKSGARIDNQGLLKVAGTPGSYAFTNEGVIASSVYGRLEIAGAMNNRGLTFADGIVTMANGGQLVNTGQWVMRAGSDFRQNGGLVRNEGTFGLFGADMSIASGAVHEVNYDGTTTANGSRIRVAGLLHLQGGEIDITDSGGLLSDLTVRDGGILRLNAGNGMTLRHESELTIALDGKMETTLSRVALSYGAVLTVEAFSYGLEMNGGSLDIDVANYLTVRGTASLGGVTDNSGVVRVEEGQGRLRILNEFVNSSLGRVEVANSGDSVVLDAAYPMVNAGHMTFAQGTLFDVRSRLDVVGTQATVVVDGRMLVNGEVNIGGPGGLIQGSGIYEQESGLTIVNGNLFTDSSVFHAGAIQGSGAIIGHVVIGSGVALDGRVYVRSGNSPGMLTFRGTTDLVNALVEIEIENRRSFDRLVFDGPLTLGNVQVVFKPGAEYVPDLNDSFAWLTAPQASGNALQLDTSLLPAGWRTVSGTADGTLELWNDAAAALGPNPNPTGAVLSVAAGALAYNDLNLLTGGTFFDNQGTVEVAGALANRPGGYFVQQNGARLNVLAGGRLSNRGNIIEFTGPSAIDNAGTLINYQDGAIEASALANRGRIENDGTLDIQQGFENEAAGEVVNRGQMSNIFTLTNRGRFENRGRLDEFGFITNTSGAQFVVPEGGTVEAGPFSFGEYRDFGGITQVDGRLQGNLIRLQGALLKGHGTLAGPVELVGAEVMPDAGTGLKIEGSATGSATFYIHWTGAGQYGRLNVTGDLDLQPSMVVFVLSPDGFVPQAGDSAQWLTIGGVAKGVESLNWRIVTQDAGAACAGCELYEWSPPAGTSVSFSGGVLSLQAAPEPELQSSALRLPDGTSLQVTLTFPVIPGYTYTVESNDSPGVTGWEPLPGAPHQTGTVIDTTTQSRRYYRLRRASPDGN